MVGVEVGALLRKAKGAFGVEAAAPFVLADSEAAAAEEEDEEEEEEATIPLGFFEWSSVEIDLDDPLSISRLD